MRLSIISSIIFQLLTFKHVLHELTVLPGRTIRLAISQIPVIVLMAAVPLWSQQVITNTQGERVVIYPDGSWRLYEEADSVLLNTSLRKNEPILMDPAGSDELEGEGSPGQLSDVLLLAGQFAEQTALEARQANLLLSGEIDRKFQLEAQLRQGRENDNLIDADRLAQLEEDYKHQVELVAKAKKHQKQTVKFSEDAEDILKLPADKQSRKLARLMVAHETYFNSDAVPDLPVSDDAASQVVRYPSINQGAGTAPAAIATGAVSGAEGSSVEHEPGDYQRYQRPCEFSSSEFSTDKNRRQLVMEKQQIFTHTDPDLRTYFRDKELITCNAFTSRIGEYVYLTVNFSVASPNARKNFGGLAEGSLLRLLLLDGTIIDLFNLQGDGGKIDPYTGNTIFIGRYLMDKSVQREAMKSELDKMRVVWRTGYEDYQIYHVDFLINQINCLNNYQ